jgi:preprotein translocase subunit SecG
MLLDILLAILIVVCLSLIGVILLQRSEGGALGMSGGGPGNFMTARGTGDLLTRATQILGAMFFALCLAMTLLSGHNHASSIVDRVKIGGIAPPQPVAPPATAPGTSQPSTTAAFPPAAGPANRPAPSGQVGIFGEAQSPAKGKPAPNAAANPLANITVQSSAPPASH